MNNAVTLQPLLPMQSTDMIVVAVNDEETRNCICDSLQAFFRVVGVGNGHQGWQMIVNYVPSLVIADLTMPREGLVLCPHLKNDDRTWHIPIIIIAAKADMETRIEALNMGADDYMEKPIRTRELQARARNLVEARKKLFEKYRQQIQDVTHQTSIESIHKKFIEKAIKVVELHMDDSQFGVENFAREVGLSTVQLYRNLRSLTGFSPNFFIREQRLLRSAMLLAKNAGNVADVAYRVGFHTLPYFSKCFRAKFGCNPKDFARRKMAAPVDYLQPQAGPAFLGSH